MMTSDGMGTHADWIAMSARTSVYLADTLSPARNAMSLVIRFQYMGHVDGGHTLLTDDRTTSKGHRFNAEGAEESGVAREM
jgi:hypothetical protein